jgi:hypothetical protein
MNGCLGAGGESTGAGTAGAPEYTGSEPASGPSGMGAAEATAANSAVRTKARSQELGAGSLITKS